MVMSPQPQTVMMVPAPQPQTVMMVPAPQPRMVMRQEPTQPSVQVMQSVLSIDNVNSGGWTNVGAPQVVWQGEEQKQIVHANEELLQVARTPQTFAGAGGAGGGNGAGGGMINSGGATGKNTSGDPTIVVSRPSLSRPCLRMPHFAQAVCNFEPTSADGSVLACIRQHGLSGDAIIALAPIIKPRTCTPHRPPSSRPLPAR
jgi:hypothetical protein